MAHIDEAFEGEQVYCIDWRVDGGPWHFDVPAVNGTTYDPDNAEHASFTGYVGNLQWNETRTQEIVTTHWSYGLTDVIDLTNHRYEFRMRLAMADLQADPTVSYLMSPYSNMTAIGGGAATAAPTALAAPEKLSVEVVKDAPTASRVFNCDGPIRPLSRR